MPEKALKGPRPVRALFNLGILSLTAYAVTVACLTPGGHAPSIIVLGLVLALYAASLFSLHIFVQGEARASKEAADLRAAIADIPKNVETTRRAATKLLIVRNRPGRVRSCGFTIADASELIPGQTVQLRHYSLLKAPFHMVDTWVGPVEVSADGERVTEVKGKAGPTRRSVWWATPGSITFASREEVASLATLVKKAEIVR